MEKKAGDADKDEKRFRKTASHPYLRRKMHRRAILCLLETS